MKIPEVHILMNQTEPKIAAYVPCFISDTECHMDGESVTSVYQHFPKCTLEIYR